MSSLEEINCKDVDLHECVGSGSSAEVFRATWRRGEENITVAVKKVGRAGLKMSDNSRSTLAREVSIMAKLCHEFRHPNVVNMFGIMKNENRYWILQEYCAGGSCHEILHKCDHINITDVQQLQMCKGTASGMAHLHSFTPPILHRDLKSGNLVLLTPVHSDRDVPVVKITDFGLSNTLKDAEASSPKSDIFPRGFIERGDSGNISPSSSLSRQGSLDGATMTAGVGTAAWMAPEMIVGQMYDEKIDVYSYAMVIFEIITRELPFADDAPELVCQCTLEGHRPDLEAVPDTCPEVLLRVMQMCWHQDAHQRPSFEWVVSELEKDPLDVPAGTHQR